MPDIKLGDGTQIFCREWLPETPNGEVVLLLHGVESHSEWFEELAGFLCGYGFAVFAYDRPGWGQSPGMPGHLAAYADAVGQLEEIARALRQKHRRLHLAGLSWGGMLAAYAALRRGILFDSLVMLAPGICPREGVGAVNGARVAFNLAVRDYLESVPLNIKVEHFTNRPDKAAYIKNDPRRTRRVTAGFCWETLKMRRFCHESAGVRGLPPAALLLAENDDIIDNTATRGLFTAADVRVEEVPGAAHSLVFEAPEICARTIARTAALAESREKRAEGKKIAVLGAGAVGSFVGGMLALGGNQVTLVAREAQAEAVNRNGLRLQIGGAERTVKTNLRAVTALAEGDYDLLLITVKNFSLAAALAGIKDILSPQTVIASLQNGIGNEKVIKEALPDNPLYAGVICAYLDFPAPGSVICADDRIGLALGAYDGNEERLQTVAQWLRTSGMEVRTSLDAAAVKWSKLLLNVAFNALNAVTGLATDKIMAHPEYGRLAARALKEAFAVLRAEGIQPFDLPGYPVRQLSYICRLPAAAVARALAFGTRRATKAVSSMQQDLRRNRGLTEINAINGVIVELAARHGLDAGANRELCALVEHKAAQTGN